MQTDPNTIHQNKFTPNPFDKFIPNTYNEQYNNFMAAYSGHKEFIKKTDFRNRDNVIHNNLAHNLLSENLFDYVIDIDSKDRDIATYPNPFKYNVIFAPVTKGIDRREEWIDPNNKSLGKHIVATTYIGNTSPYIDRSFKNVKYIQIDNVILPKYYGIIFDVGSGQWIMDPTKNLLNDRFVVMKITNISSKQNLSTNQIMNSSGIKLVPDTTLFGGNFYKAIPANNNRTIKIYNDSNLGNLDRLYIEFYNSVGEKLQYNNLDSTQPITDVRNPENINLQNSITITIGAIENELATDTKFSK